MLLMAKIFFFPESSARHLNIESRMLCGFHDRLSNGKSIKMNIEDLIKNRMKNHRNNTNCHSSLWLELNQVSNRSKYLDD